MTSFTVGQFSQWCLPNVDQVWKIFCQDWLLSQFMSGNALPFVGKFYVYFILFSKTFQIQKKNTNTYPFVIFNTNTKKSVFKYNYKLYLNPTLVPCVSLTSDIRCILYYMYQVHKLIWPDVKKEIFIYCNSIYFYTNKKYTWKNT